MNAAPTHSRPHLACLDGLRAVTAIYVVLCHAFLQVNFRGHPPSLAWRSALQIFFYGHFAVDVFIVLSGVCLMMPVVRQNEELRGGALAFFKRRAWRIIPPYYAAIALSLALIWTVIGQKTGTHWDISIPVSDKSVFSHLIFLQDAVGEEASINHVFWSIAAEWRIYFFFPLLVWSWGKFGALPTVGISLVVSYALFVFFSQTIGNSLAAHYLGLFAMGMLGADIAFSRAHSRRRLRELPWPAITAALSAALVLLFHPQLWHGPPMRVYVGDYAVGVWSTALLITALCREKGWLARSLGFGPLAILGTFAYSLYLIHAPLLQVLWQYVFVRQQSEPMSMLAALDFVGVPLILAASYGFFLLFERPFLKVRKRASEQLLVSAALAPAP